MPADQKAAPEVELIHDPRAPDIAVNGFYGMEVTDGQVSLYLYADKPNPVEPGKPQRVTVGRLVMNVLSFAQIADVFTNALGELEVQGLIVREGKGGKKKSRK